MPGSRAAQSLRESRGVRRRSAGCIGTVRMVGPQSLIASIVLDHPECVAVLDRFRIDYGCPVPRTLAEACDAHAVPLPAVHRELEHAVARCIPVVVELRTVSVDDLVACVIQPHHRELARWLPRLRDLAARVASTSTAQVQLSRQVADLAELLLTHLEAEEDGACTVGEMQADHEEVRDRLAALRDAANGFVPPARASADCRRLYEELRLLEADTLRHLHVESHVLVRRVLACASSAPSHA
jgi:regulator of cell morphogenesis and NO signaling